jgi:mannose-6-phosphate isomerase
VQQTCDVTYRLYDYGRPRELHLKQGLAVVKTQTAAGLVEPVAMDGFTRLIQAKYFVVDLYRVKAGEPFALQNTAAGCVVGLSGYGLVGGVEVVAGQAVVLPSGLSTVETAGELTLAWCWEPA